MTQPAPADAGAAAGQPDCAFRRALTVQLAEACRQAPISDRLKRAKALADAMGPRDPRFDIKAYTDRTWDEA